MRRYITMILSLAVLALPAAAQDYDDIYYNPKKKTAPKATAPARTPAAVSDYPASDTYTPSLGDGLQMSVDEYNRHYTSAPDAAELALDSLAGTDAFAYTRRLERFHNPDVIAQSGDEELAEYYYATEPQTVVNVNVIELDPWDWWGPGWNWAWSWRSPFYPSYWNPYYGYGYNWAWGPTWSWGWGGWYDPWFGWGPSWSWGPALPPPGHGPAWGSHAWRPSSPGASRPHRTANGSGMANSHRPGNNGYGAPARPGTSARPGSATRPSAGGTTVGRGRFGNSRTGSTGINRTQSGSGRRATGVRGSSVGSQRSSAGSTNRARNSSSNSNSSRNNSNNSNWNNSHRSSGSSFGSGSFGGGSRGGGGGFGGGSHSSGGGRGRR